MATVKSKRRVLSVEGKFKVMDEIKNGKNKAYVCLEYGPVNSRSKLFVKTEPKLFVCVKGTDREQNDFENRTK
jgi:hypothetical protein